MSWKLAEDDSWQDKVSPVLLEKMRNTDKVDFMVLMKQSADVSASNQFNTKDEKAIFVYTQLQAAAKSSQTPILNLLEARRIKHRAFLCG